MDRGNYVDALVNDLTTEACLGLTATGTTLERYRTSTAGDVVAAERDLWDLGMRLLGWKNLVLRVRALLNVNSSYGGSTLAESPFTYSRSQRRARAAVQPERRLQVLIAARQARQAVAACRAATCN